MYKIICPLLLLTAFSLPFYSAKRVSQKVVARPGPDSGKTKIVNPEGKTPFPYQHTVDAGIQDRNGTLWFGTSEGLYSYEGRSFTSYKTMAGLPVDHVTKMLQGKTGKIWFGAFCGLVGYDPSTASFTSTKIKAPNGVSFLIDQKDNLDIPETRYAINHLMEDKRGNVWFSAGYNVYRTDGKSAVAITTAIGDFLRREKVQYHCPYPEDFGVSCLYEDKQGNILVSTGACSCGPNISYRLEASRATHSCMLNTCKHDLRNAQEYAAHYKELDASFTVMASESGNTRISFTNVLEDRTGNVWLGTDSGAYLYDGRRFIRFAKDDALTKSDVIAMHEDKQGNIWFATGEDIHFHGHGVFRYDPSAEAGTSVKHFTLEDGLCSQAIFKNNLMTGMAEDEAGRVWFSGYGGVCYYDGKVFRNFTKKDGFNEQPVNFVLKDKSGNMWFGGWELGLYKYDGKLLTPFTENKPGS